MLDADWANKSRKLVLKFSGLKETVVQVEGLPHLLKPFSPIVGQLKSPVPLYLKKSNVTQSNALLRFLKVTLIG